MKRVLFISVLALILVFTFAALAMAESLGDQVVTGDVYNDNGLNNANQTGVGVGTNDGSTFNSVNKVVPGQRTHGEYQTNTNSCASCHQTHTGAAKSLLFKDGVFTTCTACHDGTLGFFNVFELSATSSAGTFGGDDATGNPSVHFATGAMTMAAAPGGYKDTALENRGGEWTGEFNCASCHSPHGSYSDRLLHYNPNGMAATAPEDGGQKADRVSVYDYVAPVAPATLGDYGAAGATTKLIAVRGTAAQHGITDADIGATDLVIMIYEKSATGTTYAKTTAPWMYGYPVRAGSGNSHFYFSRLFTTTNVFDPATPGEGYGGILNANGTYPTANAAQVIDHYDYQTYATDGNAYIKYAKGYVYGSSAGPLATAQLAEIARNYVVKLDLIPVNGLPDSDGDGYKDFGGVKITTVNQRALFAGETHPLSTNITDRWGVATPGVTKVSGWGVAMSKYCSACHTDYLAKSGAPSGTFETNAYRHSTTSDSYTCVRCHYAHGTDAEIMRDAKGRSIDELALEEAITRAEAKTNMLDQNASSALKRYTNMSVCWACHTSSHAEQLKNTDSYDAHEDPAGLPATEGKYNWPS